MKVIHKCCGCGRTMAKPTLACGRCTPLLPAALKPDLGLAARRDPSTPYWQQVASAVRRAMEGHRQAKDVRSHPRQNLTVTRCRQKRARA